MSHARKKKTPKPHTIWSSPIARVIGILAASYFAGCIIISIGVGSMFTSLNTVMSPLVCPGDVIIPGWEYHGHPQLSHGPDLSTRWICVNETTREAHVAGYRTIVTAGAVYGLLFTILGIVLLRRASKKNEPLRDA